MKLIRSFAAAGSILAALVVQVPRGWAADVTPPQLQAAWVDYTLTNIHLQFSEPMDPATTQDPLNYTVSGGVTVQSATLEAGGLDLTLVTTPMTPGATYTLSVAGVLDRAEPVGNLLSPNPTLRSFHLDYRTLGYLYLSPLPGAEYVSAQTRFVLVRFKDVSPSAVTNLSTFLTVTGSSSGIHSGQTHVAMDGRTVICQMTTDFSVNEVVTVSLAPHSTSSSGLGSYEYQFVVGGHTPDVGTSTARGDNLAVGQAKPGQATAAPSELIPGAVLSPWTGGESAAALKVASHKGARLTPKFAIMPNGVSVPSDFPQVTITARGNPAPDYIWLENVGQNATFQAAGSVAIDPRSVARLSDGSVQFGVVAPGAATATVLGSTDLVAWQVLQTVPVTNGAAVFADSAAANFPQRFYRVRLP